MPPSRIADIAAPGHDELLGSIDLRYVARAGLLPELSRQTYDALWKAIREAVLNAVDADATRVDIDFSGVQTQRELLVTDNGCGMSMREFCEQFMSLGGSGKFGNASRFGRIGIGSLALLQYAEAAVIETKRAGSRTVTRGEIRHPWELGREARAAQLGDLSAGCASEFRYGGNLGDHFTCVRLIGVNSEIVAVGSDPNKFYALLERLRRILPLPWAEGPLSEVLAARAPALVDQLREHVAQWSAPVVVHSPWERDIRLMRRAYGDDRSGVEAWSGAPVPIIKTLTVGGTPRRKVVVLGYLLNQLRASSSWSGLTARVQNVAVEEQTFFDMTADPGFRKYISGEVWLLGDLDRERLINIDRASFNRECADYQVTRRFMNRAIADFKTVRVQRPQRAKVDARRLIEEQVSTLASIERVAQRAADVAPSDTGLPSSEPSRRLSGPPWSPVDELERAGVEVLIRDCDRATRYELEVTEDGTAIRARVDPGLVEPTARVGRHAYAVQFVSGSERGPAIVIRNRPRRIIVNVNHPLHRRGTRDAAVHTSLALELAYLLGADAGAGGVYDRMIEILAE